MLEKPSIIDMVGIQKWEAWSKLKGISKLEAKLQYIQLGYKHIPNFQHQIDKLASQQPKDE